jgi:hypothetical protein
MLQYFLSFLPNFFRIAIAGTDSVGPSHWFWASPSFPGAPGTSPFGHNLAGRHQADLAYTGRRKVPDPHVAAVHLCVYCTIFYLIFFYTMYFGYLLGPPPPLCELARPAEWGFEYMFITGQSKRHYIILRCYDNHSSIVTK